MLGRRMEAEIREQPAALAENSARYQAQLSAAVSSRSFDMVVLTARGSSDHAALYARYLIEVFLGLPVSLAAPSVVTRFGSRVKYRNALGVGISQSGAAPDVSEVLEALRADGHTTLAITNTTESRAGKAADLELLLGVGDERSLPATKTYSATLLALYQLVRALGAELAPPEGLLPGADWLESTELAARGMAGAVAGARPVFALGRGFSFASAMEQALKLMECALVPCQGYSSADFAHGPRALAQEGCAVILFGGASLEGGCSTAECPKPPGRVHEALIPLWEAFFAQWLALHTARTRGLDPDAPPNLSKITRTR